MSLFNQLLEKNHFLLCVTWLDLYHRPRRAHEEIGQVREEGAGTQP